MDLIRNISSAIVQCGLICLLEFFVVLKPKNKKKSSGQMRQLYAYVANESTFSLKVLNNFNI